MSRKYRKRQAGAGRVAMSCLIAVVLSTMISYTAGSFEDPSASALVVEPSTAPLYFEVQTLAQKEPISPTTPEPVSNPWTVEEIEALAKMLYGECRGVPSKQEQAACVWVVLNRCDAYEKGIIEVVSAPYQFVGYDENHPVWDNLYELSEDVVSRWYSEKNGETNVGRVIPPDYLYFHGDGAHNHFRNEFKGGTTWDWSYPNPYET